MQLETKRLILRDYILKDAQELADTFNEPRISRQIPSVQRLYSIEDAEDWIRICMDFAKQESKTFYDLAIELKRSPGLIGTIGITPVSIKRRISELSYCLREYFWGQGLMYEAAQRIIDFSFQELGLKQLIIKTSVENPDSNRLTKRLGFHYRTTKSQRSLDKKIQLPKINIYTLEIQQKI